MNQTLESYLARKQKSINRFIKGYLPGENVFPALIHRAMRYSSLSGGKRIRPILTLASGEAVGGDESTLLPVACACELVHTYSLIHDDLPAMDNDDFRRGKATCHKVFGEAIAILAGDALLTLAFQLIAERVEDSRLAQALSRELAGAAGSKGMVGGQVLDMGRSPKTDRKRYIRQMHSLKTGALIGVSVRAGALAGGASRKQYAALTDYGEKTGLAFQMADDLLDEKQETEANKLTYPAVYGAAKTRSLVEKLITQAKQSLGILGKKGERLAALADYIRLRRA